MKISNPILFRENITNELHKKIKSSIDIAKQGEEMVYNQSIQMALNENINPSWTNTYFVNIYTTKIKNLMCNLQLWLNNTSAQTHYEWNPSLWEPYFDEIRKKELDTTNNLVAATDVFTCGKCKSKKCTYTQQQTRCADEGITTFVTCLVCDKKWKIN